MDYENEMVPLGGGGPKIRKKKGEQYSKIKELLEMVKIDKNGSNKSSLDRK